MGSWPPPAAPRAQISRMPYLPGLDGLRALAVGAVMVYHANHAWLSGGFLGVEVFFVISGYLITLLLIGEHERTGRVALGQFWLRRARRLLPALFVLLGALAIYLAIFYRRPQGQTRGDFIAGIFYGSNWYQVFVGQGYTAAESFVPLRHLWSLGVEEQFYLIWPLIMVGVLRLGRDRLPKVAIWLAGVSVAITLGISLLFASGDIDATCSPDAMHGYWKMFGKCISINDALYLNTFSRAGGLMLGAAFAMLWRPIAILRGPLRDKGRTLDLVALVGLVGLGALMWGLQLSHPGTQFGITFDPWLFRGGFLATSVVTLMIIAGVTHRHALAGTVLGNPVLRWIGTRSYGMYLFHWPIYQIIRKQAGIPLTFGKFAIALAITLPVTELSYRLVEMPIRRGRLGEWLRGDRRPRTVAAMRRRRQALVAGAALAGLFAFAGVSIATADNLCVGQIACSLDASVGTTTLPLDPATTTSTRAPADPAPTTTIAPPDPNSTTTILNPTQTTAVGPVNPVTPTTVATATTLPPPPAMQAFGDSVMQGAAAELTAGGFSVDAQKSRQGMQLADLLAGLRATNQIAPLVVIQIGTNGSVSNDTFDRIMQSLPANLVPTVRFLTIYADRAWTAGNNERVAALPGRYPNVQVADWAALAPTLPLCPVDHIHIACGGGAAQAYANLIFDSVGRADLKR